MRLDTHLSQRMDQRMILAPRMIQSMEILQLPIMALQERIQQELQENPVLEQKEVVNDEATASEEATEGQTQEDERTDFDKMFHEQSKRNQTSRNRSRGLIQ